MSDKLRNVDGSRPGAASRGPGRPPKGRGQRRCQRVVTFVTDAEYGELELIARQSERSLSFVVHRLIATQLESSAAGRAGAGIDRGEPGKGLMRGRRD